jgi:hypothetical protein
MLSLVAILGASALAAQSPAPVQSSFGVMGQTSGQSQAESNPARNGANIQAYVIIPPEKPRKGKRNFQYQFETPQAGANAPSVFVLPSPAAPACPVSMRAEHRSGGGVITTGKSQIVGSMQHIRLILDHAAYPVRVTAATVTIRGTNGKWRTMNASQFQTQPQPSSPYISSTLNAVFLRDGDDSETSDLELPGFTSVKSIRLDSVTYADGTIWTPADGRSCRVEPDPLMLVSSR